MRLLFLVWSISAATASGATGVDGIISMQNWEGSAYQAICEDGSFETLTEIDFRINNACPWRDPNGPNNILTMTRLIDGTFDVTCDDLSRQLTDLDAVVSGLVCDGHGVPVEKGLHDSNSMQSRGDGTFNLICLDGSREVVSALDLRLDNVCPKLEYQPESRTILAMTRTAPGVFTVTCNDLSVEEVSGDGLRSLDVCNIVPPVELAEGEYRPQSSDSYWCSYYRVFDTVYDSTRLSSFSYQCENSTTWYFTCSNGACSESNGRTIEIQGAADFIYKSGGYTTRMLPRR